MLLNANSAKNKAVGGRPRSRFDLEILRRYHITLQVYGR
jgi:hypothetical protein